MRYVYAHFPINVNLEKNKETGLFEVEIRYGALTRQWNQGESIAETTIAGTFWARSSCGG